MIYNIHKTSIITASCFYTTKFLREYKRPYCMMYIVQEAVNQTIYMTEQAEQKLQEIAPGLIKQVSLTVRLGYGRIK